MHARKADNRNLKLIHEALKDGPKTTLQLHKITGSLSINTDVSELRQRNVPVSSAIYLGRTSNGRKVYAYRLEYYA